MNNLEAQIERITQHMDGKRWNEETEYALQKLNKKGLTLTQKARVMAQLFPDKIWTVAQIASKEKRI